MTPSIRLNINALDDFSKYMKSNMKPEGYDSINLAKLLAVSLAFCFVTCV